MHGRHKRFDRDNRQRAGELTKARDRRGNSRLPNDQAFIGLDWIEALGKRRNAVRHHYDVGVLQIRGHACIWSRAEQENVWLCFKSAPSSHRQRVWTYEHNRERGARAGKFNNEIDIET